VLISWGDIFRNGSGRALRYGFNNDFLNRPGRVRPGGDLHELVAGGQ
jgi:hypothetical protein